MAKQKTVSSLSNVEIVELYKLCYPARNKNTDPTLATTLVEEPIFCLRGMDETAPLIIMDWIRENLFSAPEDKLRSAFEQALAMKKFEDKRRAD